MDSQNLFHAGPSLSVVLMLLICRHISPAILWSVLWSYLIKSGVGKLQDIDHANDLACLAHDRQIQVMPIYRLSILSP